MKIYIKSAISPDQDRFSTSKTGIAYKVFKVVDGKLYPPKVANAGGADTPIGVWLDAEEGEFAGISGKDNRMKVKSTDGSTLAYRPGWHLGDSPLGVQFNKEPSWEIVDKLPKGAKIASKAATSLATLPSSATRANYGKYVFVKSIGKYARIKGKTKVKKYFPRNFIWARCQYIMNVNYQEEAHEAGTTTNWFKYLLLPNTEVDENGDTYHILQFTQGKNIFNVTFKDAEDVHIDGYPFPALMENFEAKDFVQKEVQNYFLSDNLEIIKDIIRSGSARGREMMVKFIHRYGDIKHLPTDGYYRYRTNPDPKTVPWIISGSIKVLDLLGDSEVDEILRKDGLTPIPRQGGPLEVDEILHGD